MPEIAFPKLRVPLIPEPASIPFATEPPRYAELHCLTNYSFLQAASHPDELVQRAAELNYAALAITDRHSLAGVVRAHAAAKPLGFKLLIGTELTLREGMSSVLLATNREGYARLSRLLTVGKRRAPKGECDLSFADVADYSSGLLACVLPDPNDVGRSVRELQRWRDVFGDRCYGLAELHRGPHDDLLLKRYQEISRQANVPFAASNNVLYHIPERRYLHDVLNATRHGVTVAELGEHRLSNGERHLRTPAEMASLFAACPELFDRTLEIASRCEFCLDELKYEYPEELCPRGETPLSWLTSLTWKGARDRYPNGIPDKIRNLIERELELIEKLRYEAYFLTVWDLVKFARSRGILCQGRGSAANSAVCFCLEVTSVDPERIDVLFERFISEERNEAPDIDIDFEHERREEVLQYIYEKYGRDRAAMTAEVITYRTKSAVRDIGKALGLSLDRVDSLAKAMEHARRDDDSMAVRFCEVGFDPTSRVARQMICLVQELLGFPRHLSQHVGGMVITRGRLDELVPLENAAMPGRTVLEWDKDDLDVLGLLKVDCLGLGMLTAIRKSFELLKQHKGKHFTLATIPAEDPAVYEMLCRAESIGVFQVESRAQMSMLPRLLPEKFYDLVVEVAIVRPGPIQGNMVHPYLRRRSKEEDVTFPSEAVRAVLEKTMGVPIFQEQAMKLVMVAAGFTAGEADQLRRAMGAWRRRGIMEPFRQKLLDGMRINGYDEDFANRVYQQIQGFGEYGFPESHAASFALLVYASAWLKWHHPDVFTVGLLNSQPLGFYAPAQLVSEARRQGVQVLPVDINVSHWDCTLEPRQPRSGTQVAPANQKLLSGDPDNLCALRLGMRMIRGFKQASADKIVQVRQRAAFVSRADFVQRTGLGRPDLALLAKADAFRSLVRSRRTALWDVLPSREQAPLFDGRDEQESPAVLPAMTPIQEVVGDYQTVGLSLRAHPVSFIREELDRRRIVRSVDLLVLESDRRYRVAGLVLLRQRPSTAKGITFMTIEDETGTTNLVVHVNVWERFRPIARRATALIAHGMLQRQKAIVHLVVDRFEDLTWTLGQYKNPSRDFH